MHQLKKKKSLPTLLSDDDTFSFSPLENDAVDRFYIEPLDKSAWDLLQEALESPATPTEELVKLMKKRPRWDLQINARDKNGSTKGL